MVVTAPHEAPAAVHSLVLVVVHDGLHHPVTTGLVLGAAVHLARGVVAIDQVDLVPHDHVDRAIEAGQDRLEVAAHALGSRAGRLAHPHLGDPQLHEGIEVTSIEGHGVADRQLLDLDQ